MDEKVDRISIERGQRENYYDKIEFLKNKTRKEQFFFAAAFGFKNGSRRPLKNREGFFLIKDMAPHDKVLIKAIAIMDAKSEEILSNKVNTFKIAEEYANAGIKLLYEKYKSIQLGSFDKQFERDLFEMYEELSLKE